MSGVVEGGREYREGLLNASPFIDGDPRRPATTTMGRKGGQQVTPEHKHLASVYKIRFSLGAQILEGLVGEYCFLIETTNREKIQAEILIEHKEGKNRKTSKEVGMKVGHVRGGRGAGAEKQDTKRRSKRPR